MPGWQARIVPVLAPLVIDCYASEESRGDKKCSQPFSAGLLRNN